MAEIDFENNRLGRQIEFAPIIHWNIGPHLQVNLSHVYKKLEIQNQTLFSANLSDLRISYQFDQRQFLRFIAIYSDIQRDTGLYTFSVEQRSRDLGAQLLYSYKVNPLTKFFIGLSNAAEQHQIIGGLSSTERSIFMKFSYAWLI